MRKILIFLYFLLIFLKGLSQDIPKPMDPLRLVNDYANLLQPAQRDKLEQILQTFNDTTSIQIVVVIVPSLNGMDANFFAFKIGETWGVGQKGKNNGLVVLVKPKTVDSRGQIAISVGYGLEHVVTDALSKRIIETKILPFFREGKYFEGIVAGVHSLMLASQGQFKANKAEEPPPAGWVFVAILVLVIFSFVISVIDSRRRHYTIGKKSGDDWLLWMLMGSMLGSSASQKSTNWRHFSSGSGSFGGFKGFGGGSFGGGGASGSW